MSSAWCCPAVGLNLFLSACPQTWVPTIPWVSSWARRDESEFQKRLSGVVRSFGYTYICLVDSNIKIMLDINFPFLAHFLVSQPAQTHRHTVNTEIYRRRSVLQSGYQAYSPRHLWTGVFIYLICDKCQTSSLKPQMQVYLLCWHFFFVNHEN